MIVLFILNNLFINFSQTLLIVRLLKKKNAEVIWSFENILYGFVNGG